MTAYVSENIQKTRKRNLTGCGFRGNGAQIVEQDNYPQ